MLLKYLLLHNLIRWDTDPDSGGGGADPAIPPAATGGDTKPEPIAFTPDQQAYLDKLIGKARSEGRESAKKELETAQSKAAQLAEEQRLKEQAEWQKLAETHEAKAKELEPQVTSLSEKVTAYETVINDLLTAKIKALGDVAKRAVENLPGAPDALAKLQWLNANENLFKPLGPGNQIKIKPAATATQEPVARPIVRL